MSRDENSSNRESSTRYFRQAWQKFGKTWRNVKTKFGIGLSRDEERKMEIYATSYSPSLSSFDKFFIKLGNSIFSATYTSSSLDSARNYCTRFEKYMWFTWMIQFVDLNERTSDKYRYRCLKSLWISFSFQKRKLKHIF